MVDGCLCLTTDTKQIELSRIFNVKTKIFSLFISEYVLDSIKEDLVAGMLRLSDQLFSLEQVDKVTRREVVQVMQTY